MEETNITNFMSAEINEITAALSAFQGEVEQPTLNKENPYFKSRYVDLCGVLKAAQPILAKNGLSVTQIIVGGDLITLLSHKSGQWFKSVCPIGQYKSQQDRGSAITYTKRYAICAILGIAADSDDDGNSATDADQKAGGLGKPQAVSQPTYTNDQLQKALQEMCAVKSFTDYNNVWTKWVEAVPALAATNSEFYKYASAKSKELSGNKG